MITIPDFATHYYPAEDRPFQNLSDLSGTQLSTQIEKLMLRKRSDPGYHRVFGPKYMAMRAKTETKMRDLFCVGGGVPERHAPHYFVLGESTWFEGLYSECRSVKLPLDAFPDAATSVTYPDSFVAMRYGEEFGLPSEPVHPAHNQVFKLADLPRLVQEYGLPCDSSQSNYANYHTRTFEKYIEIQLWSDNPVAKYLI